MCDYMEFFTGDCNYVKSLVTKDIDQQFLMIPFLSDTNAIEQIVMENLPLQFSSLSRG